MTLHVFDIVYCRLIFLVMYTGDIVAIDDLDEEHDSLDDHLEIVMTVNKPLHCKLAANLPKKTQSNNNPAFGYENYLNKNLSDCKIPQYRNGFEHISSQELVLCLSFSIIFNQIEFD